MPPNAPAGPLLLGYVFGLGLYGVLTVQIYIYHAAFPKDAALIKFLVYSVHMIETGKTILMAYDAYDLFATGFADTAGLDLMRHIWLTCCIINGLITFIVQVLYAYRIKVLSTSYRYGLGIAFLSFIQLIGSVVAGITGEMVGRLDTYSMVESVGYLVSKGGAALCDILIASLMTYYLLKMKRRNPFVEDILTRIVRLVVGAGTLTSFFSIIDIILHYTDARNGSSWAFRLIIGKFYSNSMMVVFNSRFSIRNNRYDYNSEPTWRSFQVSTCPAFVREVDTTSHISFNHSRGSEIRGGVTESVPDLVKSNIIPADNEAVLEY